MALLIVQSYKSYSSKNLWFFNSMPFKNYKSYFYLRYFKRFSSI